MIFLSTSQADKQIVGMHFIGRDESGKRMEIFELKDHPYFVGVQFHPEYLSRVLRPSKPYLGFVAASAGVLLDILGGKGKEGNITGLLRGVDGALINGREGNRHE